MVHPENPKHVNETEAIVWTCVAYGNPLPYINWSRNGSSDFTIYDPRVNVTEELVYLRDIAFVKSKLELCNSQISDSIGYSCTASNGVREEVFHFELSVIPSKLWQILSTIVTYTHKL